MRIDRIVNRLRLKDRVKNANRHIMNSFIDGVKYGAEAEKERRAMEVQQAVVSTDIPADRMDDSVAVVGDALPSTSIPSVDRRFSPYDCFARDGVREPWEPQVDGIIIQRGYQKYLVMWQDEAERRSGGAKFGQEIPVEEFERDKHVTTCPKGWHDEVDHKSIKRFSVRELAH